MRYALNLTFSSTCFLAAGLLAVHFGCSGSGGGSQLASRQDARQKFIETVQAADGSAEIKMVRASGSSMGFPEESWVIDLTGVVISDSLLEAILQQMKQPPGMISNLNLSASTITNEQLLQLDTAMVWSNTMEMDLSYTAVDDATLDQIDNLYCINTLNLSGTQVTAAGVQRFLDKRKSDKRIEREFKKPEIQI